jgi:hypothetical protein
MPYVNLDQGHSDIYEVDRSEYSWDTQIFLYHGVRSVRSDQKRKKLFVTDILISQKGEVRRASATIDATIWVRFLPMIT